MNRTLVSLSLALSLLGAALPDAYAQSADQLRRENAQLKAELAALQARCVGAGGLAPPVSHIGDLEARLESIRVGRNGKRVEATVTMTVRNTGATSMILNYEGESFAATDSNGYRYEFPVGAEKDSVKGIPISRYNKVDASFVLGSGRSATVTFQIQRVMATGQTVGDRFDINASFGQYEDLGQGRLRRVQTFPVAFQNQTVAAGIGAASVGGAVSDRAGEAVENAAGRLLDRIFK